MKQHQKCYGYYFIVLKFSTSTTNSFSVFPTELKDRSSSLHVHRFRLSGSSCNFLWFISMKPPSLLLVFTPVFFHMNSLSFCYPSWYQYNKTCYKCMAIGSALVYFQIIAFHRTFSEQRRYSFICIY